MNTINIKFKSVLFGLLFFSYLSNAQIKFCKTWKEAIVKAKIENKLIYLDVYTTWCGPCKIMSKNYHQNPVAGNLFNRNFISLKLDAEKGEGKQIAKMYKTTGYPSNYFIDANTLEMVHFEAGCPLNLDGFLNYAIKALAAQNDSNNISKMNTIFESNNYTFDFLPKYLSKLESLNINNDIAINAYLTKIPTTQTVDSSVRFLWKFTQSFNNNALQYFNNNKASLLVNITSKIYPLQRMFLQKLQASQNKFVQNKDDSSVHIATQYYLNIFPKDSLNAISFKMDYYKDTKSYANLYSTTNLYYNVLSRTDSIELQINNEEESKILLNILQFQYRMMKMPEDNWNEKISAKLKTIEDYTYLNNTKIATALNEAAFEMFLHYRKNTTYLQQAIMWLTKAQELLPTQDSKTLPFILDTHASLLYAIGENKQAITMQQLNIKSLPKSAIALKKELQATLNKILNHTL
jgi:thiol-disulfide isomerase/thioredoxin